eukprot:CAMPEP_0206145452 /NCGR_PEP_ID=MMETSP1473-20131121/27401_1 /ASSEMBLY_ACC=CAM_ASM_001109 /TAXON_ID=1461547 /ORGANISM="Stichococcus sp, Strain RCC1054" /LENGTH=30 /DNA_ID= /DNA_START= /DNA_END= /DNA_ORIENTATION=
MSLSTVLLRVVPNAPDQAEFHLVPHSAVGA